MTDATAPEFTAVVPTAPLRAFFAHASKVMTKERQRRYHKSRSRRFNTPALPSIPILGCAKLSLQDGVLRLAVTDLDMELVWTVGVGAAGSGERMVPIVEIDRLLGVVSTETVELSGLAPEQEGTTARLAVGFGMARATLLADQSEQDYPALVVAGDLPLRLTLPSNMLAATIDKVLYAVGKEETRYYLTGVHLSVPATNAKHKPLRWAATDGHRLAIIEDTAPPTAYTMPGVIVPAKAVRILRRLCADRETRFCDISIDAKHLRARIGDYVMTTKLIDGVFPDIDRVIPKAYEAIIAVNAPDLLRAVRRVASLARGKNFSGMRFYFGIEAVEICLKVPHVGEIRDVVPIEWRAAPKTVPLPCVVGFNPAYLRAALTQHSGEITISLSGLLGTSPLKIAAPDDRSAYSIMMPMQVVD